MGVYYLPAKAMGLKKRDSHFNSNVLLEVLFSLVHKKPYKVLYGSLGEASPLERFFSVIKCLTIMST